MKRFNLYPDQILCLLLGALPVGIFALLFGAFVEAGLSVLFCDGEIVISNDPFRFSLLSGAVGGVCGLLLGYWLRNVQPQSKRRWIWLSLLIPQVVFAINAALNLANVTDFKTFWTADKLSDLLIGSLFYQSAALVSGVIAIVVIAILRLIQKIIRTKRAAKTA